MNKKIQVLEANASTYKSIEIKVAGNTWSFLQVTGNINYVNIKKVTNNPFVSIGKDFKTWEDAEGAYGSADMQMAIFSAQTALNA